MPLLSFSLSSLLVLLLLSHKPHTPTVGAGHVSFLGSRADYTRPRPLNQYLTIVLLLISSLFLHKNIKRNETLRENPNFFLSRGLLYG